MFLDIDFRDDDYNKEFFILFFCYSLNLQVNNEKKMIV